MGSKKDLKRFGVKTQGWDGTRIEVFRDRLVGSNREIWVYRLWNRGSVSWLRGGTLDSDKAVSLIAELDDAGVHHEPTQPAFPSGPVRRARTARKPR